MEWAIELDQGLQERRPARDQHRPQQPQHRRPDRQRRRLRGVAQRRGAPAGGRDEGVDDTVYLVGQRRQRRRVPAQELPPPRRLGGRQLRHLGRAGRDRASTRTATTAAFWGGPGADTATRSSQTYRGPGPFSEPESRNIQALVSRNQVMTLITNHTTAGARAARARPRGGRRPGRREPRLQGARRRDGEAQRLLQPEGLRALRHHRHDRGLELQRHRRLRLHLRDLLRRAELRRPATATTRPSTRASRRRSKEWTGDNPQANHTLPGAPNAGFDGKGNREAYYLAAESTLNEQRHSVLEGTAPAGATLRLTKQFKTETFPQAPDDKPLLIDDKLETVYDVGSDGRVRWHVNPSTRPLVAKATGVPNAGAAEPAAAARPGGVAGSSTTGDDPANDGAAPSGDPDSNDTLNYNDHPITVPADRRQRVDERARLVAGPGQRLGRQALRGHQRRRQVGERRARSSARARPARATSRRSRPRAPRA